MKSSSQAQRLIFCCVSIILFIGLTDHLAAQTPDLIISAISTTTGPVAPNAQFSLSNSAKNQGTVSAGSFVIAFHLSVNNTYGGADDIAFTQTRTVASLAAGATSTANTNLKVPASAPLGNYYVCALSDSNSTVTESNEINNSLCTSTTIQVAAADLIVSQVTPNASTVNAGATLSVTNAVQNLLNVKTGTLRIAFRLSVNTTYGDGDDVTISTTRTVSSLAGNATNSATTNITIPTSTTAGNYYVCAKADSLSQVVETNEGNNTLCSASTVSVVRPAITTLTPPSGPIGTSVTISGSGFGATQGTSTVKFNGTVTTPTSWSVNSISAPVPTGATTGNVVVTLAGVNSNGVLFTVTLSPISYFYDELGRLVGVSDPASDTAVYKYDAVGNLLSIVRQNSSTVAIIEFTPNSGPVGTSVTIYGTGFSPTPSQNTVTFNGVVASVSSATTTQIVVTVPAGATTGLIGVTTPSGSATSSVPFTISASPLPTIISFPAIGSLGIPISITGTNFEANLFNNRVKINITPPTLISATTTTLVVKPFQGSSGRISVATPAGEAISSSDFYLTPSAYISTDVEVTNRISVGQAQVVTINSGGKIAMVLFDGTAGQQISLGITNVTFSGSFVSVLNPDATLLISPTFVGTTGANLGPVTVSTTGTHTILVTTDVITTAAGNGIFGDSGDGGPATSAKLKAPYGVAVDTQGNIFIADYEACRIRKVNTSGIISTVAGNGTFGFSGDGGPATNAQLRFPKGVAVDSQGNIFIADTDNQRIRKVATNGIITTVAGTGNQGYSGDGGSATSAMVRYPDGVAVDSQGNLYIADTNNSRIRKVTNGIISTVAGNGISGYTGDGGLATVAQISFPRGVSLDTLGNIFIADTNNDRIRKVSTGGIISTIAGTGMRGYNGDAGVATSLHLNQPYGVAIDSQGSVLIADAFNNRTRKIVTTGSLVTIAGNGLPGFNGDQIPPYRAELCSPEEVAVDGQGKVFIATGCSRIRSILKSWSGGMTLTLSSP